MIPYSELKKLEERITSKIRSLTTTTLDYLDSKYPLDIGDLFVILVTGPSGSGKTWISEMIRSRVDSSVIVRDADATMWAGWINLLPSLKHKGDLRVNFSNAGHVSLINWTGLNRLVGDGHPETTETVRLLKYDIWSRRDWVTDNLPMTVKLSALASHWVWYPCVFRRWLQDLNDAAKGAPKCVIISGCSNNSDLFSRYCNDVYLINPVAPPMEERARHDATRRNKKKIDWEALASTSKYFQSVHSKHHSTTVIDNDYTADIALVILDRLVNSGILRKTVDQDYVHNV